MLVLLSGSWSLWGLPFSLCGSFWFAPVAWGSMGSSFFAAGSCLGCFLSVVAAWIEPGYSRGSSFWIKNERQLMSCTWRVSRWSTLIKTCNVELLDLLFWYKRALRKGGSLWEKRERQYGDLSCIWIYSFESIQDQIARATLRLWQTPGFSGLWLVSILHYSSNLSGSFVYP